MSRALLSHILHRPPLLAYAHSSSPFFSRAYRTPIVADAETFFSPFMNFGFCVQVEEWRPRRADSFPPPRSPSQLQRN